MMANALAMMMPPTGLPGVDPTRQPPMPGMSTSTAVAPAPMQAPRQNALATPMTANFNPPKPKQQNMLLSSAVNGFQRGFDPKGWQAGQDQAKADKAEGVKKQIAMLQNIRALPMEQRMQALPQISQSIGKQIPPELMQDQAIDTHLAMLMGEAGMAPNVPDPMSAYEAAKIKLDQEEAARPQIYSTSKGLVEAAPGVDPRVVFATEPDEKPPWQGAVKGPDGNWITDPNYIKGYLEMHPGQAGGSSARLRPATPEEAAKYGPAGTMGQIDDTTGRFYPTSRPNPQTGGMPTEGERKFGLYAKTARDALGDIESIEFKDGIDAPSTFDRGGQLNPFDENSRKYDQAIDRFLDGWSRAMTGAAMTNDEKQFYYGIMKPTFGDNESVRQQKAVERRAMVERLKEAAARGYTDPQPAQDDGNDESFIDSLFPADDGASDQIPEGITPEEWNVMPPEDRALFQ